MSVIQFQSCWAYVFLKLQNILNLRRFKGRGHNVSRGRALYSHLWYNYYILNKVFITYIIYTVGTFMKIKYYLFLESSLNVIVIDIFVIFEYECVRLVFTFTLYPLVIIL